MIALWIWLGINLVFGIYALVTMKKRKDAFYFVVYPLVLVPLSKTKLSEFWVMTIFWIFTIFFFPFLALYLLGVVGYVTVAVLVSSVSEWFARIYSAFKEKANKN